LVHASTAVVREADRQAKRAKHEAAVAKTHGAELEWQPGDAALSEERCKREEAKELAEKEAQAKREKELPRLFCRAAPLVARASLRLATR
jgi:hypothetical protein